MDKAVQNPRYGLWGLATIRRDGPGVYVAMLPDGVMKCRSDPLLAGDEDDKPWGGGR